MLRNQFYRRLFETNAMPSEASGRSKKCKHIITYDKNSRKSNFLTPSGLPANQITHDARKIFVTKAGGGA